MKKKMTAKALTWETILKRKEDLSSDEKILVDEYESLQSKRNAALEAANDELKENCKTVCGGMCSDIIPEFGWIEPVKHMAYEIEALNILFKKYRVYADFDQTKEKYADFRGYYSIHHREAFAVKAMLWIPRQLDKILTRLQYNEKTVVENPGFTKEIWTEVDPNLQVPHEKVEIIGSEKTVEKHSVKVPLRLKKAPQRHKMFWTLKNLNTKLMNFIYAKINFLNDLSSEEEVIQAHFSNEVDRIVDECVRECRNYCIRCGHGIGKMNGNDAYSTTGWYTYVCKDCAKLSLGGEESCVNLTKLDDKKKQNAFKQCMKNALDKTGISLELVKNGSCSQEALDKLASREDETLDAKIL